MRAPTYYPPILFDSEAAAAYLSISPRGLAELQSKGLLIPRKHGAKRMYHRDDLEKYAESLQDWART